MLAVVGVAFLLVGAGCVPAPSSSSAPKAEVQAAFSALLAAGDAGDEAAAQALVSVPIDDGVTVYGLAGYFEDMVTRNIDWSASTWSNNNNTVSLQSVDGITLGVWNRNASGTWKVSSAFWFES